ncbi:MAG: DNA polymerase III subunit gamma/tau [Candidatus Saccharimonadales bacterium]
MRQALYRKYRSKSLDEVVGQDHIITTLSNALKNNNVSHAYLFTGPRGVGKTSIARILAHEVNELKYEDNSVHLDIIEIDAASNRRIDEIRDLRDKVHISPASAKYKVYIIDEVHMLTKEAFNALLKTLEEPPEHVIFILATTEVNKLPETIISRTQHFKFNPIAENDIVNHLKEISQNEGIALADDAAKVIAEHGDGSFRDSISLLDKLKSTSSEIDLEMVNSTLGLAPNALVVRFIDYIEKSASQDVIQLLENSISQGVQVNSIILQMSREFRDRYLDTSNSNYLTIYKQLASIEKGGNLTVALEIVLLESCQLFSDSKNVTMGKSTPREVKESPVAVPKPATLDKMETPAETTQTEPIQPRPEQQLTQDKTVNSPTDESDKWQSILAEIKKEHNTLYGVLRMSTTSITDNNISMKFKFPFHQKKAATEENLKIITDTAKKLTGITYKISVDSNDTKTKPHKDEVININNIFGETEMLES